MTTPNAELAYKVLDHIDAHPEQWNQGVYIGKAECGTVACFAGWACLLSGEEPRFPDDRPLTDMLLRPSGAWTLVPERAEVLLGIERFVDELEDPEDPDDDVDLFAANNSREWLGVLVEHLFGPRPGGEPR